MKKIVSILLVLATLASAMGGVVMAETTATASTNIFAEFVAEDGNVPEIAEVISTTDEGTYILKKLKYKSIEVDGVQNICYAIVAYPKAEGTYPGAVVYHGGSQCADEMLASVKRFVQAGYVVIAPELPWIAGAEKAPYSSGAWKTNKRPTFAESTDPTASGPYAAVVAGLQAVHLLQSNNAITDTNGNAINVKVDKSKIGITGISWGGYMVTMVAGILTDQINSMFSYFGCGFYNTSSYWIPEYNAVSAEAQKVWMEHLDPGKRAGNITANYFLAEATNDTFFHPPASKATFDAVKSANKGILFSPNTDHSIMIDNGASGGTLGGQMEVLYFDYYVNGKGKKFPTVTLNSAGGHNGEYKVSFTVENASEYPITSSKVYCSKPDEAWTKRTWEAIDTQVSGNVYSAVIPYSMLENDTEFFLVVSDARPVSVSSQMYAVDVTDNWEEKNDAKVRFGVVGDADVTDSAEKVENAFAAFTAVDSSIEGILLMGDMVSTADAYDNVIAAYDRYFPDGSATERIWAVGEGENPQNTFTAKTNQAANFVNEIGGYTIITAAASDSGSQLSTETESWLKAEIKNAVGYNSATGKASSTKPVFLMLHYPIQETASNQETVSCSADFKAFLADFPQVINLSAHAGVMAQSPKTIWQDGFTAYQTPSLGAVSEGTSNPENPYQAAMIEIDENDVVRIYKMDISKGKYIGEPWVIDTSDSGSFKYTAAKKSAAKAPVFPDGAAITFSNLTNTGVTLAWSGAAASATAELQDNYVEVYKIKITDAKTGTVAAEETYQNDYYSGAAVSSLSKRITGLEGFTKYNAEITAISPLDKVSEPLSASFITIDSNINEKLYKVLEAEENNVTLNGTALPSTSGVFQQSTDASGGKFVRSNGIFGWSFTPEKTGYYTFDIVTGGQADAMSGDSTFTVDGKTVFTGVIETNDSWGLKNAKTTRLFKMKMKAGTTYKLSWATYPTATTVCPDCFNVYYAETFEAEAGTVSGGASVSGNVATIPGGGSVKIPVNITERGIYRISAYGTGNAKGTIRATGSGKSCEVASLQFGNGSDEAVLSDGLAIIFMDAGTTEITLSVTDGRYSCDEIALQELTGLVTNETVIEAELYDKTVNAGFSGAFPAVYGDYEDGLFLSGVHGSNISLEGYKFTVDEASVYSFDVIGAADNTATDITITIDGDETKTLNGTIEAGDWKCQNTYVGLLELAGGEHTLSFTTGENSAAINGIRFKKESSGRTEFILNAETDFDIDAGHGIGWYETTPESYDYAWNINDPANNGYVEIEASETTWYYGSFLGRGIVFMNAGEWLRYTVDADYSGYYHLVIHIASMDNEMSVTINDDEDTKMTKTGKLEWTYSGTVTEDTPHVIDFGYVWLDNGKNTIKVHHSGSSGFLRLDAIYLTCPDIALYQSLEDAIDPIIVNAESDFDLEAGQGVGYYDNTPDSYNNPWVKQEPEKYGYVEVIQSDSTWYNAPYTGRGWVLMEINEWLRYTVDVDCSGYYMLDLHLRSMDDGAEVSVIINGDESTKMSKSGVLAEVNSGSVTEGAPHILEFGCVWLNEGENTIKIQHSGSKLHIQLDAFKLTPYDVSKRVLSLVPGTYTAKVNLDGWVTTDIAPVLYAGVYDRNDMLVSAKLVSEQDSAHNLSIDEITTESGQYVKLFLWRNGDMKPLMDSILYEK